MTDDFYVFPGTATLRNKLGVTDPDQLDAFERRAVVARAAEGIPTGDFDLTHLRAIHRHLFQDVYDWAGELRTVEISKGGDAFMFRQYIQTGMADVHRRIVAGNYFQGLAPEAFAAAVGPIMGDVNYIHPFREGNGRTQLFYLKQLSLAAGHDLDLRNIEPAAWLAASRRAHCADYDPMSQAIRAALERGAVAQEPTQPPPEADKSGLTYSERLEARAEESRQRHAAEAAPGREPDVGRSR
jgi:cell filamentation protein